MSKILILSVGALLAVSAPAMAQSSSSGSQMNQGSSQNQSQSPQVREQIRQDLTQAGFTDVNVVPGEFIVQAKNKSGQPVFMVIGPHSVTGLVGTASGNKANTTGSTNMGSSSQSK